MRKAMTNGDFFSKLANPLTLPDQEEASRRYRLLRRNLIMIMATVALLPLVLMAVVNHNQYQRVLKGEIVDPMRVLLNKTRHSFEMFVAERSSAVSFIASAYGYQDLADQKNLDRIFQVMRNEYGGFVDLGMIDASGYQVSYVGPYELSGKQYKEYDWFQDVLVKGSHISDVFLGYRRYPHFVVAVKHHDPSDRDFILRATIDTEVFYDLIASMGIEPNCDAFVVNREGVLQTSSKFYGKELEQSPIKIPSSSFEPDVIEIVDPGGRAILLGYSNFRTLPFTLMLAKPRSQVLRSWYTVQSWIFIIFSAGVVVILAVAFKLSDVMVRRIEESDRRRELTHRSIEHTNKLASIGRLAAGIAHEINNPLAIINEKAGLMEDLLERAPEIELSEKFFQITGSIKGSVERCRSITHRLLGFARRMDVEIELIDVNEVLREVYSFLEREAFHREIKVGLELGDVPSIPSDHGQLQQVFLNILNNAFTAIDDGGEVTVTSFQPSPETVAVKIQDNGVGMSKETIQHIFEPFFSAHRKPGTGLGLSITYGIVEKLGGSMHVESVEGQGATFTVLLPTASHSQSGEDDGSHQSALS
jgi:two-component system NtrC family sensor kinase